MAVLSTRVPSKTRVLSEPMLWLNRVLTVPSGAVVEALPSVSVNSLGTTIICAPSDWLPQPRVASPRSMPVAMRWTKCPGRGMGWTRAAIKNRE